MGDGDLTMGIETTPMIGSQLQLSPGTGFSGFAGVSPLVPKMGLISKRILRRVMAAKESLVKFGTFVPRNDRQADASPEASRWKTGRDLE